MLKELLGLTALGLLAMSCGQPKTLEEPLSVIELPADRGQFEVTFDEEVVELYGISSGRVGDVEIAVEARDLGPGHVLVTYEVADVRGEQDAIVYFGVLGEGDPNVELCDAR